MSINWICYTKSESELFLYTRNLYNERFKLVFKYKIIFLIFVLVLWIHKGYCVVKKLVWIVRINLSGVQNALYVKHNTKLRKTDYCPLRTKMIVASIWGSSSHFFFSIAPLNNVLYWKLVSTNLRQFVL